MAFVKFSSEYAENSKTQIDNIFFNDYLPYAPSDFVKVYIYAVYMSGIGENPDNNIENFCKILGFIHNRSCLFTDFLKITLWRNHLF